MSFWLLPRFLQWRHCLWQLMPWNLRRWTRQGSGHRPVTFYRAGRPVSFQCRCGQVFYP